MSQIVIPHLLSRAHKNERRCAYYSDGFLRSSTVHDPNPGHDEIHSGVGLPKNKWNLDDLPQKRLQSSLSQTVLHCDSLHRRL